MAQLELDQEPAREGREDAQENDHDHARNDPDDGEARREGQHAVRHDLGYHENGHKGPTHGPVVDLGSCQRKSCVLGRGSCHLCALLISEDVVCGSVVLVGWVPRRVTVLMVGIGLLALLPVVVEHRDGSPRRKVGLGGVDVRLLSMCCPWAEQILERLPGLPSG